jgi:hypothetical protein
MVFISIEGFLDLFQPQIDYTLLGSYHASFIYWFWPTQIKHGNTLVQTLGEDEIECPLRY